MRHCAEFESGRSMFEPIAASRFSVILLSLSSDFSSVNVIVVHYLPSSIKFHHQDAWKCKFQRSATRKLFGRGSPLIETGDLPKCRALWRLRRIVSDIRSDYAAAVYSHGPRSAWKMKRRNQFARVALLVLLRSRCHRESFAADDNTQNWRRTIAAKLDAPGRLTSRPPGFFLFFLPHLAHCFRRSHWKHINLRRVVAVRDEWRIFRWLFSTSFWLDGECRVWRF